MLRFHHLWPVAALSFVLACDGGDKSGKGKADGKKADATKKAGDDKKADDKKAGDAKKADDKKAGDAKQADAKAPEKHFDISKDKSGVLARSAAALEGTDKFDDPNLHDMSHHAEKLPSFEKVCAHEAGIKGADFDQAACVTQLEHNMVVIGPEIYAQYADCLLAATTTAEIDACEAAEAEAEKLLHEKPHGDGLSQEACDGLFAKFEKLAMDDAGDDVELVKTILEEVKGDVITACKEQGSQAEIDCSNNAKTLPELKECASKLL
ncbi:MAG: hypothetical protein AAF799_02015 [Myxococcota bacterium]